MPEWAIAVTAIISALGGAYAGVLAARRKDKGEAIAQYQALLEEERQRRREDVAELRGLLERHAGQLDEDQLLIDALYEDNGDCHAGQQVQHNSHMSVYHWALRADTALKELGKDLGPLPEPPKKPKLRMSRDRAEFRVRNSKQAAALIKEGDSRVLPPPEDRP